jgi:hypothetical protein
MPIRIHPLSRRILSRLIDAEAKEPDPWLRDDLRIARLTVAHAARGDAASLPPHVLASWEVLGLHPEKVWPAIVARRKAQLGEFYSKLYDERDLLRKDDGVLLEQFWSVPPVPKKPAQTVKLWCEKTNAARATNSRGGITLLRDNTTSVPMAAPSIAALYPNSDASSSGKTRHFNYDEMLAIVEFSGAPHSIRQGTLSALKARGRWPNEDGPATGVVCVSLIGMMLHGVCCRSTARWRARRACALGYWRQVRRANSWSHCPKCGTEREAGTCAKCGYSGRAKTPEGKANFDEFCRPYMYEIDIDKFRAAQRPREIRHFDARTYAEYKESAARREHSNVTPIRKPAKPADPEQPLPPAPAVPQQPQREQPAAAAPVKQEHRSNARAETFPSRRITRDERTALARIYVMLRKGSATHQSALRQACEQLKLSLDDGEVALKIALAKKAESEEKREKYANRESQEEFRVRKNREANEEAKRRIHERYGEKDNDEG